mmetsp:Transcript_1300/g.2147  ORF Transcript_1300/g.2147 Transcript_1300/m.2147 type:complete len:228 (+) Transcript_1300:297-980(+)
MSGVGRFWSMPRGELEEKLRMKRRRKNLSEGNDLSTLGVEQPIQQSQRESLQSLQSLSPIAMNPRTDPSEEILHMAPTANTMDEGTTSEQSSSIQDQTPNAQNQPTVEIRKSKSLGNMGPRRSSNSSKTRKALRGDHVMLVTSSADSACDGVSEGERERRDRECSEIGVGVGADDARSDYLLLGISQDIDAEDYGFERPEIEVEVVDKLLNHVQLARQGSATADQNF